MRYLVKDDYRVLVAVEMGMRNHDLVPVPLIASIAKLRHSGIAKILSTLLRHKLLAHANQKYDGYRLSYLGFDILALHTLQARGVIDSIGSQVGVGKESDVFEAYSSLTDSIVVIKLHRLGRTSFRAVRAKRDYAEGKSKCSWLYLSRLAALKEFAYMKALFENQFPTPTPIDHNRHVVVMSKVNGYPMAQIRAGKLLNVEVVFDKCVAILKRMAEHGVIHCDLNEFNLLVNQETEEVTVIDFPQLVSISHPNAEELFTRDMLGLVKFFSMKMKYHPPDEKLVTYDEIIEEIARTVAEERAAAQASATAASSSSSGLDSAAGAAVVGGAISLNVLTAEEEAELSEELHGARGEEEDQEGSAENEGQEGSSSVDEVPTVFGFAGAAEWTANATDNAEDDEAGAESDISDDDDERAVFTQQQDIHARVKRDQLKNKDKRGNSRNHTKKTNKYGKIDRSLRNLL
jgi:RIO kinase 2